MASTATTPRAACSPAASLIEAGLESQVLYPATTEYAQRQSSYWSNCAKRLQPSCIVLPRTAEEVASTVKALVAAGQTFAVRSGGHTHWSGSNNIGEGGVTIDLSLLKFTTFHADSETVDIGPGGRWRDVYEELHQYGRVVAGGREGNVGVAGFLLGGGLTFFTARQGFGCDNVVAFEVVLADGRIVTATREMNSDLFVALKGGMNNFGIVTKFTVKAIQCNSVWGGLLIFSRQYIPSAIDAVTSFTTNLVNNTDDNLMCIFTYLPRFKQTMVVAICANMAGVEKAPAYDKWLEIPEFIGSTMKMTTVRDMACEYNAEADQNVVMFTLSFKNDARILNKASELHDQLIQDLMALIPEGDFTTQCAFHPLPKVFSQRSIDAGGNVMGIERNTHDGIVFAAAVFLKTAEQEAAAYPMVAAWVQGVKDYAESIDGMLEWRYANYADKSQNPFASYGGKGVAMLRAAAAKYDPDQIFRNLCPGGFKISQTI